MKHGGCFACGSTAQEILKSKMIEMCDGCFVATDVFDERKRV